MKQIKLDQFLDFKYLSNLRYSPDGKRAVFTVRTVNEQKSAYDANLYVYEKGKVKKLTSCNKESAFFFEDSTHVLFVGSRKESEKSRKESGEKFTSYYRIATNGGEAEFAFELPIECGELYKIDKNSWFFTTSIDKNCPDEYKLSEKEKKARIDEQKSDEDYFILEEHPFCENGGTFYSDTRNCLFILNGKKIERVTGNKFNVSRAKYLNGKIYYTGEEYDYVPCYKDGLFCYDLATKKTTCIYKQNDKYYIGAISPLGENLIITLSKGEKYGIEQNHDVYLYDTKTGKEKLLCSPNNSMGNLVGSDARLGGGYSARAINGKYYYLLTERNSCKLKCVDEKGNDEYVYNGEGSIECFDVSPDGHIICVAMLCGKLQELYTIYGGEIKQVSKLNEKVLSGYYLADYNKISANSCGKDIDGWVLLPKDYDNKKSYPAILDIHGGPKTVYGEIYYHEMQYWANKGYFVFFCNPTGSDGRGDEFADIYGKYGQTDYQNIMDFTDKVLSLYPQIDKNRVAVTGGSYGGFMTNWIIGHTDRFCCAATQRSISNWVSFYGTSDIGVVFGEYETQGNVFDSHEKMWTQSPLAYAKNFKTPTLIIHSDADYRCPIEQGYQLFTALKMKNVDSRMVIFKGENHDLSRTGKPLHRIKRLKEITDWIDKYTKNK